MGELLTITELASMLKLSKRTICNLMVENTNPLPALRLRRSVRFRRSDVDKWLAKLAEKEAA
ncbi:MAG: excisionase family DNA-binding protein [Candidatus Sulfotelmatobacter sp.]